MGWFHLWEIPALILAIGAFHIYRTWNRWWIAHPRLSNGKAEFIPGTVMLIVWVLSMCPFWFWGTPGVAMWVFGVCFLPLLIVGAFHIFVFVKPFIDRFDHNKKDDGKK